MPVASKSPDTPPAEDASPLTAGPRVSRARAWAVTAMVTALMVVNFADKQVLGLAAVPIRREFHLSASAYGTAASSFYLLFSLSAILVGFLANRIRTSVVLAVIAVLWSAFMLPVLLMAGVPALLASRIGLGAAEGPTSPLAAHAVQKWFPERTRAIPTALTQTGGALGLIIAAPTLTFLITRHGWRSAFAALAVAGLVWTVLWLFIGRDGPVRDEPPGAGTGAPSAETATAPQVPYRRLFLNGTWIGGLLAAMGAYWALSMNVAWFNTYLQSGLGYSADRAGTLVTVPALAGAVLMLLGSWLSGRWFARGTSGRLSRGVFGGALVAFAGLCTILMGHLPAGPAVALSTLAFGLPGCIYPLQLLLGAQIAPVRRRSAVLCTGTALATLVGVASPAVTGRIIDASADEHTGFQHAFLVAGLLMLVGGVVAILSINPERDARH
jgi:MFS family permease